MSIYILCPYAIRTGGPEALHQLSDALIGQGMDARIAYYTQAQADLLARSGVSEAYKFGDAAIAFDEYAHYERKPADAVPNAPGNIVVLPEPLCHLAPRFGEAKVLIWWLSVDNAFGALSRINLNLLRSPRVAHVVQSEYARNVLLALGIKPSGLLGDYSADVMGTKDWRRAKHRARIALFSANPNKVSADLDAIFARVADIDPTIDCKRLIGLSAPATAQAMADARVFVDLGSFPGKDRMPREAAQLGCSVVLSKYGAAKEMSVHGMHYVDAGDVEAVAREVAALVEAPFPARCDRIGERDAFMRQVKAVFEGLA